MEKFTVKNKKPNPINIASKYSSEFFIELFNENLTSEISLAKNIPSEFFRYYMSLLHHLHICTCGNVNKIFKVVDELKFILLLLHYSDL